ncbi:excinuclease ABC subunit UvrA [Candidatus Uhrbacteria bacterium CG_4_10_14_0_8_um_filter_58_22]|uniref:UvrABC system protein A n=1 Tax=Candidatus Uhrbacteria bacterium CG_4_10_14_0_8_um_filter_58_22 TaxID=1975029 RepID=A0A2M7QB41_9BACT|nr:MAG: excinuclease ABC subunit A [Parcubacteria group bacterium CG1_02_58_44]PIY62783.1 MAG: excinuclease ABC subunit UvrA [Candidatus Uhrbacteria bacterium CG_4_10_14_0_8_um_filter_58_22]
MGNNSFISIKGARVHNLKNVSIKIPKDKFVVVTGLSGSGKSSLAFDTIYTEGQRRYVESLSSYARQFLELQDKPDVDEIRGLSPTIAIEQRTASSNPRSTVGTVTEIYDYLRVLFARAGRPHCPQCNQPVTKLGAHAVAGEIRNLVDETSLAVLAPVVRDEKGLHKALLDWAAKTGYVEVRHNGLFMSVDELRSMRRNKEGKSTIELVVGRYERFDESAKLEEEITKAFDLADGFLIVYRDDTGDDINYSQRLTCIKCGIHLPEIEPRIFSFNSPHGACPACTGLGTKLEVLPELVMPNPRLTIAQGAIKPWTRIAGNQQHNMSVLEEVARTHGFSLDLPINKLTKKSMDIVLFGTGEEEYAVGGKQSIYEGVVPSLEKRFRETDSDYVRKEIETYMNTVTCPACNGKRLRREVFGIRFGDRNIAEVVTMSIDEAHEFFQGLISSIGGKTTSVGGRKKNGTAKGKGSSGILTENEEKISAQALREIAERLKNLVGVGLGYLSLDRAAITLSGGELQRVRLATQLGNDLSGVIYVLDEPSIGLHPRDNDKLIAALKSLRDQGNSVIVVEHDEATMDAADWIIDMGPKAGSFGGEIVSEGTPAQIRRDPKSMTGLYMTGKEQIPVPKKYRRGSGRSLVIKGAQEFNLRNVDVKIPLGLLVTVTGVSGSGKSTLVVDILSRVLAKKLYRAKDMPGKHKEIRGLNELDKVITIDQSPIGRTPRSNPATYTGVFTAIRDLFTEVPEAKMKGYDAGKFSFNVKGGGRCEACSGEGLIRIEMQFLPDVFIECTECHGRRYNNEALEIYYKEQTIADVLNMTVEDAAEFFRDQQLIHDKLAVLKDVGLGYLKLGQSATTLSGGEAQRVKLATELSRRATGRTLYILDEPTTGLHFDDIKRLLGVLNQLVDKGNSVLIIEHNMDVIKSSDWIIDMGPEGGAGGGRVVAEGTPKDVAKAKDSWTGKYLKPVLKSSNTTIDRLDGEATVRKSSAAAAVKRVRATV